MMEVPDEEKKYNLLTTRSGVYIRYEFNTDTEVSKVLVRNKLFLKCKNSPTNQQM